MPAGDMSSLCTRAVYRSSPLQQSRCLLDHRFSAYPESLISFEKAHGHSIVYVLAAKGLRKGPLHSDPCLLLFALHTNKAAAYVCKRNLL